MSYHNIYLKLECRTFTWKWTSVTFMPLSSLCAEEAFHRRLNLSVFRSILKFLYPESVVAFLCWHTGSDALGEWNVSDAPDQKETLKRSLLGGGEEASSPVSTCWAFVLWIPFNLEEISRLFRCETLHYVHYLLTCLCVLCRAGSVDACHSCKQDW